VELLVKSKDNYVGTSMVGPASDSGEIRAGHQSPWQPVSMNESHMDSTSDTENSRAAETIDIVSKTMLHRQSSRDLSTSLNPREDIATCLENRSDSKEIGEDIHPQKDLGSVVAMQVASTGSVASTDVNLVIPSKRGTRESEIMGPGDSLAGMHILVAEDNRVLQKLTKTMLLRLGATVVCVDNGAEAAQLVLANLPRPLGSLVSYGSLKKRADSKGEVHEDEQVQVQVSTVKPRPFDLVLMDCQVQCYPSRIHICSCLGKL
jgi:CheY-like chemotaxis protein